MQIALIQALTASGLLFKDNAKLYLMTTIPAYTDIYRDQSRVGVSKWDGLATSGAPELAVDFLRQDQGL